MRNAERMTNNFAHIACCIDHSDASMHALDQAIRLQGAGDGRLSLLHVAPWPMVIAGHGAAWVPDPAIIMAGAKEWLDGVVAAHPGTEGVLLEGYPPAAACDWAADAEVDLLVAASSRGLFDRVLLGSFAATSPVTRRAQSCSRGRRSPIRRTGMRRRWGRGRTLSGARWSDAWVTASRRTRTERAVRRM